MQIQNVSTSSNIVSSTVSAAKSVLLLPVFLLQKILQVVKSILFSSNKQKPHFPTLHNRNIESLSAQIEKFLSKNEVKTGVGILATLPLLYYLWGSQTSKIDESPKISNPLDILKMVGEAFPENFSNREILGIVSLVSIIGTISIIGVYKLCASPKTSSSNLINHNSSSQPPESKKNNHTSIFSNFRKQKNKKIGSDPKVVLNANKDQKPTKEKDQIDVIEENEIAEKKSPKDRFNELIKAEQSAEWGNNIIDLITSKKLEVTSDVLNSIKIAGFLKKENNQLACLETICKTKKEDLNTKMTQLDLNEFLLDFYFYSNELSKFTNYLLENDFQFSTSQNKYMPWISNKCTEIEADCLSKVISKLLDLKEKISRTSIDDLVTSRFTSQEKLNVLTTIINNKNPGIDTRNWIFSESLSKIDLTKLAWKDLKTFFESFSSKGAINLDTLKKINTSKNLTSDVKDEALKLFLSSKSVSNKIDFNSMLTFLQEIEGTNRTQTLESFFTSWLKREISVKTSELKNFAFPSEQKITISKVSKNKKFSSEEILTFLKLLIRSDKSTSSSVVSNFFKFLIKQHPKSELINDALILAFKDRDVKFDLNTLHLACKNGLISRFKTIPFNATLPSASIFIDSVQVENTKETIEYLMNKFPEHSENHKKEILLSIHPSNFEILKAFLEKYPGLINETYSKDKNTILHHFINTFTNAEDFEKALNIISSLEKSSIDKLSKLKNNKDIYPLDLLYKEEKVLLLETFIKYLPTLKNISIGDKIKLLPIHLACELGSLDFVKLCIKKEADVNEISRNIKKKHIPFQDLYNNKVSDDIKIQITEALLNSDNLKDAALGNKQKKTISEILEKEAPYNKIEESVRKKLKDPISTQEKK